MHALTLRQVYSLYTLSEKVLLLIYGGEKIIQHQGYEDAKSSPNLFDHGSPVYGAGQKIFGFIPPIALFRVKGFVCPVRYLKECRSCMVNIL